MSVGEQVAMIRAERGLSLRALAAATATAAGDHGLTYTALHRVETGARKLASHELVVLADVLQVPVDRLLGRRDPTASLRLASKVATTAVPASLVEVRARVVEILEAQNLLARLGCSADREGIAVDASVPVSAAGGRTLAEAVRASLQLGLAPIADLTSIVEEDFGVIVFREQLPQDVHGYCATAEDAAIILVNASETRGRQRLTMAHELCHVITGDGDPIEILGAAVDRTRIEQRAEAFAVQLLLPDRALSTLLGRGPISPATVVRIALRFGVTVELVEQRLRALRLRSTTEVDVLDAAGVQVLADLAGVGVEHARDEAARGGAAPSPTLTAEVLAAFRDGVVGLGLVAAVTGQRDLDALRSALADAEDLEFEAAWQLA